MRALMLTLLLAGLAACVTEPEAEVDPVAIMADVLASNYEAGETESRLSLALPAMPIEVVTLASYSLGSSSLTYSVDDSGEIAAYGGPRCSIREPASHKEMQAFLACAAAAEADPSCNAQSEIVTEENANGDLNIIGVDINCVQ